MESTSNNHAFQTLEKIKCHFDFLFRLGFRITSTLFVGARDEQWQITLTAGHYLIRLHGHEERIDLGLSNLELCDEVGFFELHDLIGLIEKRGNSSLIPDAPQAQESDDFTTMAGLLEKNVDEILLLMDTIQCVVSNSKARAINNCPGF